MFQKIGEYFKNFKFRTLVDVLIVAIPVFLIFLYFYVRTPSEVTQIIKDNKKIETKVDSLKLDNEFLMSRMFELEKNQILLNESIIKNNELIQENNNQLSKLKKIYNAKITNANNYNISQLDSFFTERYKQHYER